MVGHPRDVCASATRSLGTDHLTTPTTPQTKSLRCASDFFTLQMGWDISRGYFIDLYRS